MSEKKLNIIFFGTPEFTAPVLSMLAETYNVSAVFTGKGPIKELSEKYKIKVFQPSSLKRDEAVFETFKLLNPDLCIVAAYGKILPQRYLEVPKYGFVNIHPSLLPKYRGPSPIQTAILNGDKETGVSIMLIDAEVDHGPILASKKLKVESEKYFPEIAQELFELGAKLLIETLPKYISGEIRPKEQDHAEATFTKMFTREDGKINWNESAEKIFNQIRALGTEPGTWTTWKGKILNIVKAERDGATGDPGSAQCFRYEHFRGEERQDPIIIKIDDKIAVATKKCYLILKSIQLEGGKIMDAKSFVNGHPDFLDSKLE